MHETPLSGLALIWLRSKSPGGPDAQGVDTFSRPLPWTLGGQDKDSGWSQRGRPSRQRRNNRPERCVPYRCRRRPTQEG